MKQLWLPTSSTGVASVALVHVWIAFTGVVS